MRFLPICFLVLLLACDLREKPVMNSAELFERGVALFEDRAFSEAERVFTQALQEFEQQSDRGSAARVQLYLGQIALAQGRFRAAADMLNMAIDRSRAANEYRTEAQAHIVLGHLAAEMGVFAEALEHYQNALSYYSAFNDRRATSDVEMHIGRALMDGGNATTALQYFERAYGYYQSANEARMRAAALDAVGEAYAVQGRHQEALNSFTQAREANTTGDSELEATIRFHMGLSYVAVGNPNAALEQLRESANLLRSKKLSPRLESLVLFSIGNVYTRSGRFGDAKGFYNQALAVAQTASDRIAELYNAMMTLRCDESTLKAAERVSGIEQLLPQYVRITAAMREYGHRTGEAFAWSQVGRLYAALGNVQQSLDAYRNAINAQEAIVGEYVHPQYHRPYLSELSIERERTGWYTTLAELCIVSRQEQESVRVVEKSSSREFFERFLDAQPTIRHPLLRQDVLRARENLHRLRSLETEWSRLLSTKSAGALPPEVQNFQLEIGKLKEEIAQVADHIVKTHPNYEPLVQVGDMRLADVQSLIPRGTLVVRFIPASNKLYILALSRLRFEVRSVAVQPDVLLGQVAEYMRLLNDPNVYAGAAGAASVPAMTRFATLSSQLYEYFFRPIDGLYERNLIIIPGQEFEGVPFHAFERQDRRGNVQYVVEFMSVDYLPSFSSLKYRTATSVRTKDVIAFGNPTGKHWSIDYELRDIRSFYKDATVLIGAEASWQSFMKARGDVLQVSSDFGTLRRARGGGMQFSGPLGMFVLSRGDSPGEFEEFSFERLTDAAVFPVVYLSNQLGEGSRLGPAHALLLRIAGTGDVFLNAWYGDRKAAKFFSEYFYTHLANGLAPGDAYRQALLNMIRTKDVNHPHAWGQYFHFGTG